MKKYIVKAPARRAGEQKYSYRGWTIQYLPDAKCWAEISPKGEWEESAKTFNEAKHDIDMCIEFYEGA